MQTGTEMFSACNTVLVEDSSFSSVSSLLFYPRNATSTQKTCHIFDMFFNFFSYLHCPQSMWSSVYVTVGRPSVRPIRPPLASVAGLLLWTRRPGDIDPLLHGRRSAAATAQRRAAA